MHTDFIGPDGLVWPSVTRVVDIIAKPGLTKWAGEVGNEEAKRICDEAKLIGTNAHDDIERYCKDRSYVPFDALAASCVREFCVPYVTGIQAVECKVINEPLRYHGTYDAIISVKDMPITKKSKELFTGDLLVDWKTANSIYDTNGIQLGGYWGASPVGFVMPAHGLVVRIDKESKKVYWKMFRGLPFYFEEFKHARALYDFAHHEGPWAK